MPELRPLAEIKTIDDVLSELELIIEETIWDDNVVGIFGYIYHRTTEKIKEANDAGRFEDQARMELMDVEFAKLFIQQYRLFKAGQPLSSLTWQQAFFHQEKRITNIQHAILGMNAHINVDLGVAAAMICPGDKIHELEEDFMEVNLVLMELVKELQVRLARVSKFMFLLDWVGGRKDQIIIGWSIKKARHEAWRFAKKIAFLEGAAYDDALLNKDQEISELSMMVANPPGMWLNLALSVIRFFEVKDVGRVIQALRA